MKRSGWILIGSLATLGLCAAPYGCSGKYVGSSSTPRDGVSHQYNDGIDDSGQIDGTSPCCYDGKSTPISEGHREGTYISDGTFIGGDGAYVGGDGGIYVPPIADGDGGIYGDGWDRGDGTSVDYPEGTPYQAEGENIPGGGWPGDG